MQTHPHETRHNRKPETVEDLDIWQKSDQLCEELIRKTKSFPISEWPALGQRIKNSAADVPIEIEKGFLKRNIQDKIHHYQAAFDTFIELRYLIRLSESMGYIKKPAPLYRHMQEIDQMFTGLIRSMEKKTGPRTRPGGESSGSDA